MFKKTAAKAGVKRSKLAAFAESSSDDDEPVPSKTPRLAVPQQVSKPDVKIDESAYLYDEVYEDIKNDDPRTQKKQKQQKGAVYMDKLLKAKEQRQRDKLVVQELKVEKEREAEGGMFDDKETFMTASYKKFKAEVAESANEKPTGKGLDLSALTGESLDIEPIEDSSEPPKASGVASEKTTHVVGPLSGGLNVVKPDKQEEMIQFLLKHNTTDEEIRQARERYFERRNTRLLAST